MGQNFEKSIFFQIFEKFTLRGSPGDPKMLKFFFFKSCLESSETNFGIKISHFENFHSDPPGGPPGGSKILKKYFSQNFDPYHYPVQILSDLVKRFKNCINLKF